MADDNSSPQRRPYKGSCHCGKTQYIAYLTLPHSPPALPSNKEEQRFYRCNCTICHKAGHLHARIHSSPDDFILLSPMDPFKSLGDYQCDSKRLHFFFCKTCGVRCFIFMGEGEIVDVDMDELGLGLEGRELQKVWRPKKEGWREGRIAHGCYLSVNAMTLEPGQERLDLREWNEKKWLEYLDMLRAGEEEMGEARYDRPHVGGSY